jgi:hypothetical protein
VLMANFPPKGLQSVKAVRATLLNYADTYPVRPCSRSRSHRPAPSSTPAAAAAPPEAIRSPSQPPCAAAAAASLQVTTGAALSMLYILMQSFAVPGTISLSLLAGALFGPYYGLALVAVVSARAGAGGPSCRCSAARGATGRAAARAAMLPARGFGPI